MAQENHVSVSMLLKDGARNPQTIEKVREIATKLGFASNSAGRATLSFWISPTKFKDVFGVAPKESEKREASDQDFGRPVGYHGIVDLSVPSELAEHVQLISVEAPATRLDDKKSE
jgi:AraC-like DNA-binding protein